MLESPRATVLRFVAIARPSKGPGTQNPWQRPWRTCRAWWRPQIARRPAAPRTAAHRISRWGRLRSPRRSITLERYSRRNLSSRSSTTTSRLGSRKVSRDTFPFFNLAISWGRGKFFSFSFFDAAKKIDFVYWFFTFMELDEDFCLRLKNIQVKIILKIFSYIVRQRINFTIISSIVLLSFAYAVKTTSFSISRKTTS